MSARPHHRRSSEIQASAAGWTPVSAWSPAMRASDRQTA